MHTLNKVKIIKRAERDLRREQVQAAGEPKNGGQKQAGTVRDAVTTITGWITELREKKDREVVAARFLLNN